MRVSLNTVHLFTSYYHQYCVDAIVVLTSSLPPTYLYEERELELKLNRPHQRHLICSQLLVGRLKGM